MLEEFSRNLCSVELQSVPRRVDKYYSCKIQMKIVNLKKQPFSYELFFLSLCIAQLQE